MKILSQEDENLDMRQLLFFDLKERNEKKGNIVNKSPYQLNSLL